MNRRDFIAASAAVAAGLLPFRASAGARFVDDAGRTLKLPARIARVLPAGPPASADLLILAAAARACGREDVLATLRRDVRRRTYLDRRLDALLA